MAKYRRSNRSDFRTKSWRKPCECLRAGRPGWYTQSGSPAPARRLQLPSPTTRQAVSRASDDESAGMPAHGPCGAAGETCLLPSHFKTRETGTKPTEERL